MSHVRLAVPFGFYGWGNIGDESTLQGFGRLISRYRGEIGVWVASRSPAHTARIEPSFSYYNAVGRDVRRWWAQSRAGANVFVGGTPIMDTLGTWPLSEVIPLVSSVRDKGLPIVFLGIGTEHLLRQDSKSLFAQKLAPHVLHWSVRCSRDKLRLEEYGVASDRVTVAADLAWMLDPVTSSFGRDCLTQLGQDLQSTFIGVNINSEEFVVKRYPEMLENFAMLLDRLVEEKGVRILFFCNEIREGETFDKAASRKVMDRMSRRSSAFLVPNEYWSPQQMLSLISLCRFTISMRYHFCLFSALQGVPFVAVKRSDKVDDLCWDLNWPYSVSLAEMCDSGLLSKVSVMDQDRARISQDLPARVRVMRERAAMNSIVMDRLLASVRNGSLR